MIEPLKILTHSRMACFKSCRKKHDFRYQRGIRRERTDKKLSFGSSVHESLDMRALGTQINVICESIREQYAIKPKWIVSEEDEAGWDLECEKICRMICGYDWMHHNDGIEVIATEQEFCLPIINPATNRRSRSYQIAGKIDKVIRLPDGRFAIMEHKTTGIAIDADAVYWSRLRHDHQVTEYLWAARQLGYDVQTIIYDVIHRPMDGLRNIPLLDSDGVKIVLNLDGSRATNKNGSFRQSTTASDKASGMVLQVRKETPQEYGERLTKDIGERPNFYFHRRAIPRTDADISLWLSELWQQQISIREAENHSAHYRNPDACIMPYRCEYLDYCEFDMKPCGALPDGFIETTDIHPELELDRGKNDSATTITSNVAAEATTAANDEPQGIACDCKGSQIDNGRSAYAATTNHTECC